MALAGSRSVVGGAQIQAFTFSSQDRGRLSGVWCGECGVLCFVCVHVGVVLCDELCVVLFGVLRGGGVVWCVVCFISLSFSLSLFSLLSLSRSLSFSLVSSVLSSSFSSLFFLFLFSLPFSPTNTV